MNNNYGTKTAKKFFLDELLENTKKEYELFCKVQNDIFLIFDETHKVLMNNNIPYFVAYGSLLGAVRDNGFVPWDYDFDMVVSIKDAKNAIELLKNQLPNDYYVVSNFTDGDFPYYQARVCKKGYDQDIHVDIFYSFGLPDDKESINKIKNQVERLFNIRDRKYRRPSFAGMPFYRRIIHRLFSIWKRRELWVWSKKRIDKTISEIMTQYGEDSSCFSVFLEHVLSHERTMVGNCHVISVDGHEMMVPEKIDELLKTYYKDPYELLPFHIRYKEYRGGLLACEKNCHKVNDEYLYRK